MKEIYTIGRDESCDIVVPDSSNIVSRLHATVRIDSHNKLFITDKSRNGTYVNGMKMSSGVEIPVSRKDVVSFAHVYDLDWHMVPKRKNYYLIGGIIVIVLGVVVTGLFWGLKRNNPTPVPNNVPVYDSIQSFPVYEDETEEKVMDSIQEQPEKKEKDVEVVTPAPKPSPAPKPEPVVEDTIEKVKPKQPEEIYHPNPLY